MGEGYEMLLPSGRQRFHTLRQRPSAGLQGPHYIFPRLAGGAITSRRLRLFLVRRRNGAFSGQYPGLCHWVKVCRPHNSVLQHYPDWPPCGNNAVPFAGLASTPLRPAAKK
ncbi:hypothetical protein D9M73_193420 [compost metagenome]